MHLKKLEIYGFKSFADRVEIMFPQGVTGVVGPNGSGKSNIADAVRWALGEQSAKALRGNRMEDVIFGGTEKRKALAYCEVSLTFDNSTGYMPVDYAEVLVTRRVYRDGDSEFYINQTPCRLRDVTELFRGTGMGRDGYSLIGQGRVDEILSAKPDDRRNIFEEAAGISKYRARQDESERRLKNTRENLERVNDIEAELERQVGTLSAQAEEARRYMRLAEELKALELNDFLVRTDRLKERISSLETQNEAIKEQSEQAAENEQSIRNDITAAQDEIAAMENRASTARDALLALTREAELSEGALSVLREQLAGDERELTRLRQEESEAGEREEQLASQKHDAFSPTDTLDEQRERIATHETEAAKIADALEKAEKALEAVKSAVIEGMNRLSGVKSAQARMSATREGLQARLMETETQLLEAGETLASAQQTAQQADADTKKARESRAALQAEITLAVETARNIALERDEVAALLQKTQGALREGQSRLKLLEQMEKDYDGYQHSVREVMRASRNLPGGGGMLSVVAEAIRVPKQYERAIEMALGSQLQHIICRTQQDAKERINALRAARAGRATFLPLDAVRPRLLTQQERECLSMPGCIGIASEIVSYDELYRPVIENLLGRTVIAKDLDAGIAIMRRTRNSIRLVTPDGDVMHPGGSMTGGSAQSRMTSLLSREREITEYREAVETLGNKEKQAEQKKAELDSRLREERGKIDTLNARLHEREIDIERMKSHSTFAQERLESAVAAADTLEHERVRIQEAILDIDEQMENIQKQAGGEEQTAQSAQQDISVLQKSALKLRGELDATREELSAMRVDLASAEREREAMLRDEQRREQELEKLRTAKTKRAGRMEEIQTELAGRAEHLRLGEQERDRLRASLEEQTLQSRTLEIERIKRQQRLRELLDTQQSYVRMREETLDKLHRSELQQSRAQSELEALTARIWEAYELTYGGAEEYRLDEQPAGGAARIEKLRKEIRQMGSVNVAAIQEYQTVNERYEALSAQKKDLEQAQADIENIIRELTARMRDTFSTQFDLLNKNFTRTFKSLFGGGQAELRLTDESDVLGSGIEIVAQPPGKKLQLLTLLSGGERALTAIAILFAILELNPTPFCILDEIEAALDDANIDNFADFLANYTNNTQFIVVTHRRGTMERCNALYGVSMREKGVSSMVSVEMTALDAV